MIERKIKIKPVRWVQTPLLYKHWCRHFALVPNFPHIFADRCFIYGTSIVAYTPVPVSIGAPLPVPELSYKPAFKHFHESFHYINFTGTLGAPMDTDVFALVGKSLAPVQKCLHLCGKFGNGAKMSAPVLI